MLIVSWFVCGILYFLLYCYLFCKILNIDFKNNYFKIIGFSLIFAIFYVVIMKYDFGTIKPFIMHVIIFILLKILYGKSIVKTLMTIFCIIILNVISELMFDLIIRYVLHKSIILVTSSPIKYIASNFLILFNCLLIYNLKYIKKLFKNFVTWNDEQQKKSLFLFVFLVIIIGTFILYNNFINIVSSSFLFLTNMFCIAVFVFVIGFFKEKSNNNRIIAEYDQLLEYVKNYERLIETKSKNQHEYKNQLILIQGMIKSKEAISYIDKLLKNEKEDQNIELLKKLQYLPQGGLKGLIYYKIEKMIDKKIDVYVDIASNLKNTKVLKDNLQDISKIIGVYLDNAIEAVEKADKKYIIIESYMEDGNIVFSFSNTYKGNIDLNKVDKEGYTTKGEGKGYGLSLVKDIIEKNNKFSQRRELNGIYYVQKLYIKK